MHSIFSHPLLALAAALSAVLGFAAPARAQAKPPSTNYVLSVTTDRPEALYQQGETVTFTIKLT